jgi:amino acid transporter
VETTTESPSTAAEPTRDPDRLLVRGLGVRPLTATIFNYTVGSGIFVLPALVAGQLGGAAPVAYLVCVVVMALVVLVFAEAGSRVGKTGGPYAYIETALGPLPGFVAGILLAVNDIAAAGAITMLLAGSVGRLLDMNATIAVDAIAVVLIAALAAINIAGLRWGARVVEICTAAKLIPLGFFVLVGAFFIHPVNLHWGSLPPAHTVARTVGTLVFAFTGIEAALLPSGEVRDTARTVPIAAMLALSCVTVLYLGVQTVAQGVAGPDLPKDQIAPLATAAGMFAGHGGSTLLLAGAAISMFGWLTGSLLAGPRGLFALARDGFLPARVAAVHPGFRTPHAAIVLYSVLALGLALSGTFTQLAVLSNLAALALYALCAIAVVVLRRRNVRADGPPFRIPGGLIVPMLTCIVVAWIVINTISQREFIAFGVVLAIAGAVYALRRRENRNGP